MRKKNKEIHVFSRMLSLSPPTSKCHSIFLFYFTLSHQSLALINFLFFFNSFSKDYFSNISLSLCQVEHWSHTVAFREMYDIRESLFYHFAD